MTALERIKDITVCRCGQCHVHDQIRFLLKAFSVMRDMHMEMEEVLSERWEDEKFEEKMKGD